MKHTSNRHLSKAITDLMSQAKQAIRGGATEGYGLNPKTAVSMIATGRLTREMSCDGKIRYRTYEYAEYTMRPILEAKHGTKYRVYACPFCSGGWHMATEGEVSA